MSETKIPDLTLGTAQPWDGTLDNSIEMGDLKPLRERNAASEARERELQEQLNRCAIAARSYQEAVDMGEPFGDELKAVLTLRQNADAGFKRGDAAEAREKELRERVQELEEAFSEVIGLIERCALLQQQSAARAAKGEKE